MANHFMLLLDMILITSSQVVHLKLLNLTFGQNNVFFSDRETEMLDFNIKLYNI